MRLYAHKMLFYASVCTIGFYEFPGSSLKQILAKPFSFGY